MDGLKVGKVDNNLAQSFNDNFLAKLIDVRVGSGNIWGDQDIASAQFDNVAIFNTALSEAEVDALYYEENF
ncbi:hypothetical protein D3C76_957440 [compost metagenome]